ncbi:topology modulation protein [Streptomyces sp. P9(2023)]|uniref:topology modulation protein n=1 Tax=Streptomyces sp. P9(2023) TaxID=3064394 RepID=UPI0028F43D05|nr:topology modulation protein [Streptomyces sp. P9(2023)]MDT9693582.1 topology modulation protein [Streptomyces sp. P9(2023)]
MKRVAIVGCGGSGKSYLPRELGRILDAPVTHLDATFYDDEWNELPMEKFAAVQRDLVAQPKWVIDGNYNSNLQIRLEACDTVVLMDVSTVAALYGIFSRQIRHGAGHKGNGVHNRIHWGVVEYVATYRRRMRPRAMAKIEEFDSDRADVVLLSGSPRAAAILPPHTANSPLFTRLSWPA